MPYPYYPNGLTLRTSSSSNGFTIDLDTPTVVTPLDVHNWLISIGWQSASTCPDTGQKLYTRTDGDPHHWTWTEAIAYETYKFLTLGGYEK